MLALNESRGTSVTPSGPVERSHTSTFACHVPVLGSLRRPGQQPARAAAVLRARAAAAAIPAAAAGSAVPAAAARAAAGSSSAGRDRADAAARAGAARVHAAAGASAAAGPGGRLRPADLRLGQLHGPR